MSQAIGFMTTFCHIRTHSGKFISACLALFLASACAELEDGSEDKDGLVQTDTAGGDTAQIDDTANDAGSGADADVTALDTDGDPDVVPPDDAVPTDVVDTTEEDAADTTVVPDVEADLVTPDIQEPEDTGNPLPPIPVYEEPMVAEIQNVVIQDGFPVVDFSLFTIDGEPFLDLEPNMARFAIAKLVENPAKKILAGWQSYLNQVETPPAGPWPGTEPQIQATTEQNGQLTNHEDGTYTYVFATNITEVTQPLAVPYVPEATHRVGIEFRGALTALRISNPTFTWQPSTGAQDGIPTHSVVFDGSCNECHSRVEAHGGARNKVDYCVLCHNPGTTDANSGISMDMATLIHKVHMGANLPSVQAGNPLVIWGFNNNKFDFSEAVFPQDNRNCRKCHSADDPETPNGGNWKEAAKTNACGSCHDDISFVNPPPDGKKLHTGNAIPNDLACNGCHTPDKVEKYHVTAFPTPNNPSIQGDFPWIQYSLDDVTVEEGNKPVAKFTIMVDGAPADLNALPKGLSFGTGGPSLRLLYSEPEASVSNPTDYNHISAAQNYGQPVRVRIADLLPTLVTSVDGSAQTKPGDLGTIPDGATLVAVAMDGALTFPVSESENLSMAGDSQVQGVDGYAERRQIVHIDRCNACHERLSFHGGNRVNSIDMCVGCHTPNATDKARRPANAADAVDGLAERSIAFGPMIHAIHRGADLSAESYVLYGFGNVPHDYKKVKFPGNIANCETCHLPGTYGLPVDDDALAVTIRTGADPKSPLDDVNISPSGAACTGCHDSKAALAHSKASSFYESDKLHGTELDDCGTCHSPGKLGDVEKVHGP